MKVLCIDNEPRPGDWFGPNLRECEDYTVIDVKDGYRTDRSVTKGYVLLEFGYGWVFEMDRFTPLSDDADEAKQAEDFKQWQLRHYAQRLADERKAGNVKAVAFLRGELCRLKNAQS